MIHDLTKTAAFIHDIFKNEFLSKDITTNFDENKIKQILMVAQTKQILDVDFDKGEVKVIKTSANKNKLRFLRDLQ